MAKLIGPCMSIGASGTVGNVLTFANWKGISYCRGYFIPENPQETKQVNVRTALKLSIPIWSTLEQTERDAYDAYAKGKPFSGFNFFMKRMLLEYVDQLTTSVLPVGVTNEGIYPDDVITWSDS